MIYFSYMSDQGSPSPPPSEPLGPPGIPGPPPASAELMLLLAERVGVSIQDVSLEAALAQLPPTEPEPVRIEGLAAALGLRVRWLIAPTADAAALARPDLPVFGRSVSGVWWVLDGRAPGLVHALPVADPRGPRWLTVGALSQRVGGGVVRWGLVEPVLPAAALACSGGSRSPLQRLRALLWIERADIAVVVLYGVVAGLLSLATPLAIQVLINWLAFGALLQPIVLLGLTLSICLGLAAALQLLQRLGVETIERRLFVRAVADLTARLARVRLDALDGLSGPELANRFFDVLTLQKAASTLLLDGLTALLQVTVAVLILALYHPWLLLFDLLLLLGMATALVPLGRGAQQTAIAESKAKYAVAAWIEEIARHPAVLRTDGSELAEDRADQLAQRWLSTRRDHFRVFLRQFAGVQALQVVMSAVLLVASGALVLRGQLTLGQLVAAEFIVTTALLGFAKFADKLDTVYDLLAGIDKLGALLDLPTEPPTGLWGGAEGPAAVQLQGVTLRYPGPAELPRLDLHLAPGSHTTIVGAPGTGKSALAQLVLGERAPSTGVARRDGMDLRRLRPRARHHRAVLVRPGDVITGSVRDNVALGRDGVSDERVWLVLGEVGLRERIEALPLGLDTMLSGLGVPLSTADRCALLVARAVVASPRLVVVDGLLDGLPADRRRRLLDVLRRSGSSWTLLLLTCDPPPPDMRSLTLHPGGLDEHPPA